MSHKSNAIMVGKKKVSHDDDGLRAVAKMARVFAMCNTRMA